MFASIKRKIMMPFYNIKRKRKLYEKCMTPDEIQIEEKRYHDLMLMANKKGQRDIEKEYLHKRDAIRKVLKINE